MNILESDENMKLLSLLLAIVLICQEGQIDAYMVSKEYRAKGFNFRQRFLVLHYTALDLESSLRVLTGNRVSSHYLVPDHLINNERIVYELVKEDLRAWTNGVSFWRGRSNLNDQGVNVEIVNLGFKMVDGNKIWFPYTASQIRTVIELCKDIIKRYNIKPSNVIGHSDCSPGRKVDPGPLFPWKHLYDHGIGAWPKDIDVDTYMKNQPGELQLQVVQKDLSRYGYKVNTDGRYTRQTKDVLTAFQMHFRPTCYDGVPDKETVAILKALIKRYR